MLSTVSTGLHPGITAMCLQAVSVLSVLAVLAVLSIVAVLAEWAGDIGGTVGRWGCAVECAC